MIANQTIRSTSLLPGAIWRKSTHSGNDISQCVECADIRPTHGLVAIRDSKRPDGPLLMLRPGAYTVFIGSLAERRT